MTRGRPLVTDDDRERILQLWSSGIRWREIAAELGLAPVTVWRVLKEAAFPEEGP